MNEEDLEVRWKKAYANFIQMRMEAENARITKIC